MTTTSKVDSFTPDKLTSLMPYLDTQNDGKTSYTELNYLLNQLGPPPNAKENLQISEALYRHFSGDSIKTRLPKDKLYLLLLKLENDTGVTVTTALDNVWKSIQPPLN